MSVKILVDRPLASNKKIRAGGRRHSKLMISSSWSRCIRFSETERSMKAPNTCNIKLSLSLATFSARPIRVQERICKSIARAFVGSLHSRSNLIFSLSII